MSIEKNKLKEQRDAALIGSRIRQKQFNRMDDLANEAIDQRDELRTKLESAEERVRELTQELRSAQTKVHFGEFHQWNKFDICREKTCAAVRNLLEGK